MDDNKTKITDFTITEIKFLINIKNYSKFKNLSVCDITKICNVSRNHPGIYKLVDYLVEKKALIEISDIDRKKIYKINYNKLVGILDNQILINFITDNYLKKDHTFFWGKGLGI